MFGNVIFSHFVSFFFCVIFFSSYFRVSIVRVHFSSQEKEQNHKKFDNGKERRYENRERERKKHILIRFLCDCGCVACICDETSSIDDVCYLGFSILQLHVMTLFPYSMGILPHV